MKNMVKILKKSVKILVLTLGLMLILLIVAIWDDEQKTSYLKIENIEAASNNSYIITNVNILPMSKDTIFKNKIIYIKRGVIHKISDSIEEQGIPVIDANNKFLLPGLIDMHVHVWDKYEMGLYLSNGVTAVRNLWGMPMHLRLKKEINTNKIVAPMLFTTGPKLTGPEFIGDDNLQLFSTKEAREKVIRYKKNGYDFIKTYYGLDKDLFDAIIAQATRSEMDIIAHPSQKVAYNYHFNSQIKSIEHAEDIVQQPLNYKLDSIKLNDLISDFSKFKQTNFCPTLTVYNNIYQMLMDNQILKTDRMKYLNPLIYKVDSKAQYNRWHSSKLNDSTIVNSIKEQHNFHLAIVGKLHKAGVSIICGTDAGIGVTVPGFSIHNELAFYKAAGLSNFEVLKTATVNAAKTHKIMNNLGTIEVGKMANLILVDENPLLNINTLKNPNIVFINGRKLHRNLLQSFQDKAKNRSNLIVSALRYFENFFLQD